MEGWRSLMEVNGGIEKVNGRVEVNGGMKG